MMAQADGAQLVVENTSVRTNSLAGYRVPLGKVSIPWNGLYLGTTGLPNANGVNFTDGSSYVLSQVCGNAGGSVGIYSSGSVFIRGGCIKGATKVTASSTGITVDPGGNLLVTGGITMYSDKRKKTILHPVELSLKEVAEAPIVEHYYNDDERKTTHVGSIAQYWAETIGNDWFCKKDPEGFYTMEIQNAALASAISVARELSRFESETDKRIRLLEEENVRLRKEIDKLKKR